jgi:hypothetical protein
MARASRVLTLAVTLAFAAFALAADQDCPTKPSETPLEFAPVAKACGKQSLRTGVGNSETKALVLIVLFNSAIYR